MIVNRSAPSGTIVPSLIYNDVAKAIEWLCDVFGFTERLRAGGEGKISHAQLAIGQGGVMLGASRLGQGFDSPDDAEFRPPRANEVNQTYPCTSKMSTGTTSTLSSEARAFCIRQQPILMARGSTPPKI